MTINMGPSTTAQSGAEGSVAILVTRPPRTAESASPSTIKRVSVPSSWLNEVSNDPGRSTTVEGMPTGLRIPLFSRRLITELSGSAKAESLAGMVRQESFIVLQIKNFFLQI